MEAGKVVEIIGAVIDVKFPRESIPKIFDALKVKENNLTLEVQQQIGDGVVRTIAMGSTDGLKRGLDVNNTGEPINVPVGEKTLGRIMNVLGEPIDNAGDINAKTTLPIHRPAPTFSEQASEIEILETGIKVVDLICPFAKGSKVGLFGCWVCSYAGSESDISVGTTFPSGMNDEEMVESSGSFYLVDIGAIRHFHRVLLQMG